MLNGPLRAKYITYNLNQKSKGDEASMGDAHMLSNHEEKQRFYTPKQKKVRIYFVDCRKYCNFTPKF